MWITAITTTDRIAQKVMPKLLKALTQAVSLNILSTPGRIHMITVTKIPLQWYPPQRHGALLFDDVLNLEVLEFGS